MRCGAALRQPHAHQTQKKHNTLLFTVCRYTETPGLNAHTPFRFITRVLVSSHAVFNGKHIFADGPAET